jgi:cytoskeletal protein RodZ
LNKEIVKKYSNNNYYVALVVIGMSLGLLSTAAIQATPANAANTNATQQAGAAANQTGEKAQVGAANVMQQGKSTANQTGEKAQSFMNKIGESLKSFANKTGEELDETEDEEETQDNESPSAN